MKVSILYTNKSKYSKCVLETVARWVKNHAESIDHYHNEDVDLMIIGFDDTLMDDKELLAFINSLSRKHVSNLALINCFYLNDKQASKIIKVCQENDLPLMREQYLFKINLNEMVKYRKCGRIQADVIDGARTYVEDMINVINNYY
ncbi:MAG: hypothetical protein PHH04_03640 [Thomasclavelia sp.]|nr:hypothetical protein [Thomasclavelia sp.]